MTNASASSGANGQQQLSGNYALLTGAHDEMFAAAGVVHPHYDYLVKALDTLGSQELAYRSHEARRLIRDNDVTYNIYSDPKGMGRPWALDLLPLLISSDEWARIEAGLIQRAELLNLLLADLYGPRTVIKQQIIPPELVYSDPGFLWPCDGLTRPDKRNLHLYAADLARTPDGEILVIAERAQAPSGAGYALENRIVLSQVLPSLFRDAHVHRLRSFFRTLRTTLGGLAPEHIDEPRIVLLTPGAGNEAYFEHAYLANYLGYTLVQGTDLVVRDNHVWLKTLAGTQRIDVILRRVDDEYCDPLELRSDSYLGVPGLVQAVRAGNVTIANPLGSSILQNPALMAFMPQFARHFLDEELLLPSVETLWCGNPSERQHVLANLESLVIKPVKPKSGPRTLFGSEMNTQDADLIREQIKAQPNLFVAQPPVALSTAPVLADDGLLQPRHVVLRSFLTAEDDTYRVMPGGLTRVSPLSNKLMVSNQFGGVSKDTWVLASEPEKEESILVPPSRVRTATRYDGEVSSRVADCLYWVGRYAERAEGLIRLLRVTQLRLSEEWIVNASDDYCLVQLLRAVTHHSTTYPGFVGDGANERLAQPEAELLSIITDGNRAGSVSHGLNGLLNSARSIRDRLSSDTLRVISDIDQQVWSLQQTKRVSVNDTLDPLDNLINALMSLSGLINENITREQGWHFLETGRRLERAIHTASLLKSTLVAAGQEGPEAFLLEQLLQVMDSLMTYRRRYQFGIQMDDFFDLVIHDEANPRSLSFQLVKLAEHMEQLPLKDAKIRRPLQNRMVLETLTAIRLADAETLANTPESGMREVLDSILGKPLNMLPKVSDALTTAYFKPEEQPHQLVQIRPGENS